MNLEEADRYLTAKIKETPLGSPSHHDYIARRKRIRAMIAHDPEHPEPPAAA